MIHRGVRGQRAAIGLVMTAERGRGGTGGEEEDDRVGEEEEEDRGGRVSG